VTDTKSAPTGSELTPAQESTGIMRADLAELFAQGLATIPEAGQEGWEGILATLARVEHPEDLDAPWRSSGGRDVVGRPIEVRGLRRMPSSFGEGVPFFLIADAVDLLTGEVLAVTTGSTGVVGAWIIANMRGWMPIRGMIVESERPTEQGYYPQHWQPYREPKNRPAAKAEPAEG